MKVASGRVAWQRRVSGVVLTRVEMFNALGAGGVVASSTSVVTTPLTCGCQASVTKAIFMALLQK